MKTKAITTATTGPSNTKGLPLNPDSRDWVDLRIGERCTVSGKLAHVGYGMPGTLMIEFADWSSLVIDCDRPRDTTPIELSSQVHVRAERTEDGLKAIAMWMEGSVPIPLIERR